MSEQQQLGTTVPERPSPYSIRRALLQELKANPFRSLVGTLAVIQIGVIAASHYWEQWFPEPSYVSSSNFNIERKVAGDLRGRVYFSTAQTPVRIVSGQYGGYDTNGRFIASKAFEVYAPVSGAMPPSLEVTFQNAPLIILFCLNTVNQHGARAKQEIVFEVDDTPLARQSFGSFASYIVSAYPAPKELMCTKDGKVAARPHK